ncbi:branchpoint-bridging protein-like [Leguminivora glycinivorella]|uniref:branchpoint-bridging protein-like n=1 Tax=Leguminivora glycinivorella TaxID=1035111 RepID=UPI00200EDB05|nr:branchpoint-bridging protein-like [Leguminivora glycinivorella]
MESAEKDSSAVESQAIGIHYNASQSGKKQCTACGDTRHERFACKFKDYVCDTCSRVGHLRRVCPDKEGHRARARPAATKSWGAGQEYVSGSGGRGYNERATTGRGGGTAGRRRRGARSGAAPARQHQHCIRDHPGAGPAEAAAAWRDDGGEGAGPGRRADSDDEWPIYQMGLSQYPPV